MDKTENNIKMFYFKVNNIFLPFFIIIVMTLLNAFYNSMASQLGFDFPLNTFLFWPDDLVADLLKYPLSFPGEAIPDLSRWNELYQNYYLKNPYSSDFSSAGSLTNLHTMPVTIMLAIFQRYLLSHVSITIFFILFQSLSVGFLLTVIVSLSQDYNIKIISAIGLIFLYPFLFLITRGNFPAAILAGLVMIFSHLGYYKKSPYLIALLIAMAANIRPNAIYFLVIFFLSWGFFESIFYALIGLISSLILLLATSYLAHKLYPIYSVDNFISALSLYYAKYVLGNDGLAYGSSLLGGLKFIANILHFNLPISFAEKFIIFILGVLLVILYYFYSKGLISKFCFLFILFSIYILYPNVLADYHLIPLFGLIMIFCKEALKNESQILEIDFTIACLIAFVLSAKNYIFYEEVSYQVFLNPMLLSCGIGLIAYSMRSHAGLRKNEFIL